MNRVQYGENKRLIGTAEFSMEVMTDKGDKVPVPRESR